MDVLGVAVPAPIVASVVFFLIGTVLIADCGGGFPIISPIFVPLFSGFKPTAAYARLKSKYVT